MFFAWYNNLDNALTEFFAKVWSYFTWQNFVFIMTGIVMGFVLCMGFYSLIVMYTIKQEAKTKQTVIDPNDGKLNKLVDEIKARYKEESVGMSVKEKAALLGNTVYDTINIIAGEYYPNSKYPIYELSIEEMLQFLHYLPSRIDLLFSNKYLNRLKKTTVSQIFRLIEVKKKVEEQKAIKAVNRLKLYKISQFAFSVLNYANPVYWIKKWVIGGTVNIVLSKSAILIIDIVADETNKMYSKSIFDQEKALRSADIEKVIREIEQEGGE